MSVNSVEHGEDTDLVSYLAGDDALEKYIGYIKPVREDLASVVLVATEVEGKINIIG